MSNTTANYYKPSNELKAYGDNSVFGFLMRVECERSRDMKRERDREKQEERFLNIQQSKETQSYLINKKKKSPLKMTI